MNQDVITSTPHVVHVPKPAISSEGQKKVSDCLASKVNIIG